MKKLEGKNRNSDEDISVKFVSSDEENLEVQSNFTFGGEKIPLNYQEEFKNPEIKKLTFMENRKLNKHIE